MVLAILLSFSGSLMITGVASLLSHIPMLKSWFKYLSSQSLRIMVLHSYLMLPGLIDVILGYMRFRPNSVLYYSAKTLMLMISVILICIAVNRIKNKQREWMQHATR